MPESEAENLNAAAPDPEIELSPEAQAAAEQPPPEGKVEEPPPEAEPKKGAKGKEAPDPIDLTAKAFDALDEAARTKFLQEHPYFKQSAEQNRAAVAAWVAQETERRVAEERAKSTEQYANLESVHSTMEKILGAEGLTEYSVDAQDAIGGLFQNVDQALTDKTVKNVEAMLLTHPAAAYMSPEERQEIINSRGMGAKHVAAMLQGLANGVSRAALQEADQKFDDRVEKALEERWEAYEKDRRAKERAAGNGAEAAGVGVGAGGGLTSQKYAAALASGQMPSPAEIDAMTQRYVQEGVS